MELLDGPIQTYAWGSRTLIAELLGRPSPAAEPQAELWLGTHPSAPARVLRGGRWQSLLEVVAAHPDAELGPAVAAEFGPSLPFLLKLLAAEQPLSLQAHPNRAQAERGFAEDEARGLERNAPTRRYRDKNHKPELICALSEFDALCGFRPSADTRRLLEMLDLPELAPVLALLERADEASALEGSLAFLLQLRGPERVALVEVTLDACARIEGARRDFAAEAGWARRLGQLYPGDVGCVVALLLNLVRLQPGQALYLPAGNLHAYLRGFGVEIMASSDNVLRGGLTPKYVDAPELLNVLEFRAHSSSPLRPTLRPNAEWVYPTPAREFRLSCLALDPGASFVAEVRGPEIVLCVEGALSARTQGCTLALPRGAAAFVRAASPPYELRGPGTAFRAVVGAVARD